MMRVLHIDTNHPLLMASLNALGFVNDEAYTASKAEVEERIHDYDGVIIRGRFTLDRAFLAKAVRLKFIGRVGAGLENIAVDYAVERGICVFSASGGNANAVGEHALGMLLSLFNNFRKADGEVRAGKWLREANRGLELDGKTVGIIGYGNTGKAFAKKLRGFTVEVLCYDILPDVGDECATQVSLTELQKRADVLSLHIPQTPQTMGMVNRAFIKAFARPFWLINTARGRHVVTVDLVEALKSGKILGAGLDVLEYEKKSFESLFTDADLPEAFEYLTRAENVLLTPHIAGWTVESKEKLAQLIVAKIKARFC